MKKIDKVILGVLGLGIILLFVYGFTASTGFVIAVSGAAISMASLGAYFWAIMLIILIVLLVLLRIRNRK